MPISFHTTLTPSAIEITLPNEHGKMTITKEKPALPDHSLYLFFKNKQCIAIGQTVVPKSWDHIVLVQLPWDLEASHLSYLLQEQAESTGLTVEIDDSAKETIPQVQVKKLA